MPAHAALCEQCAASAVLVRLQAGAGRVRWLCEVCMRDALAETRGASSAKVVRFFTLLARSRRAGAVVLPALPPNTTCAACGLRYIEFEARGLVGCGECYNAFSAAIVPALEHLGRGANGLAEME